MSLDNTITTLSQRIVNHTDSLDGLTVDELIAMKRKLETIVCVIDGELRRK